MEENYKGIESCYDMAKLEYERELNRNEKLDNKISITLTFCGVLFLFTLKYLDFMKIFKYDKIVINSDFMTFIKLVDVSFMLLLCYFFGKCIYILFNSMEAREYIHYKSNVIFDKDLPSSDEDKVKYYNTYLLVKATNRNYVINENRTNRYNLSVRYIKKALFCIVLIELLSYTFFS